MATHRPSKSLVAALRRGDATGVRAVLQRHYDDQSLWENLPSEAAPSTKKFRVLAEAANAGLVDVVSFLWSRGVPLEDPSEDDAGSPLCRAASAGQIEVLEFLLGVGVRPTPKALAVAAGGGHLDAVQLLLKNGAPLDMKDSALWLAAREGHVAVMSELFARGVNVEARDEEKGETPLWIASSRGHVDAVERLLAQGADVDAADAVGGRTPLWIAAATGHVLVVSVLVAHGAELEAKDSQKGQTPLFAAARAGHAAVIRALSGADVERVDLTKWTPLNAAVASGNPEAVEALLDAGANINAARQPLVQAVRGNNAEVVQIVLDAEVDVGFCDSTVVDIAVENENEDVLQLLLAAGARLPGGHFGGQCVARWLQSRSDDWEVSPDVYVSFRRDCVARLFQLLQYDTVTVQTIASIPMVRDVVSGMLAMHKPASVIVVDGLFLVLLALSYMRSSWELQHFGPLTTEDHRILGYLLLSTFYVLAREAAQAFVMSQLGQLLSMLKSIWNWTDLLSVVAALALTSMAVMGEEVRTSAAFRVVGALGAIPIWLKVLGYIKALNLKFATFVMTLLQIARDLRSFVVVLLIILGAFANVLFVLLHPRTDSNFGDDEAEEPFVTLGETLLTSYRMLLGDFEREWFSTPEDAVSREVAIVVFVVYLLIMNVLLLNVLIAVVSDSYEFSVRRSLALYYQARLELAVELQTIFGATTEDSPSLNRMEDFLSGVVFKMVEERFGFQSFRERKLIFWVAALFVALVLLPFAVIDALTWLLLLSTSPKSNSLAIADGADEWKGRAHDLELRMQRQLEPIEHRLRRIEKLVAQRLSKIDAVLSNSQCSIPQEEERAQSVRLKRQMSRMSLL